MARHNDFTNPRAAVDTTNMNPSGGAPITRHELPGFAALTGIPPTLDTLIEVSTAAGGAGVWLVCNLVDGVQYTASVYGRVAEDSTSHAPSNGLVMRVYSHVPTPAQLLGSDGGYHDDTPLPPGMLMNRLAVTFTAAGTGHHTLRLVQVGTGALTFIVTGVMVERAPAAGAYSDGEYPGWEWTGTPHASASRSLPRPTFRNALAHYDLPVTEAAPTLPVATAEPDLPAANMDLMLPGTDADIEL